MYPRFEKELKENIVEYGRTLKSLESDEILMLKIKMTECEGCDIPEVLELSIKASELANYSAGKISKEAAMAKVGVKKS